MMEVGFTLNGGTGGGLCLLFWFLALSSAKPNHQLGTISRHHKGDMFVTGGSTCDAEACVSGSSGSARASDVGGACTCQCLPHVSVFRDDLRVCTDDIQECSLAPFVSETSSQKIPFVFLPLKGQIVYPSAEISFIGVTSPICVVSSAQFLTGGGWMDIRNTTFMEPPFRLFRDEGRTFLQWLGEVELRMSMEGRLILVHLICKDIGKSMEESQDQYIFTPCVAFRVAGTPNVREVSFAADAHASVDDGKGLSVSEYVAIAVCTLLLGLIYVASVFLYLHVRRRRKEGSVKDAEITYREGPTAHQLAIGEDGVVKKNPLLQVKRQHHLAAAGNDNECYQSDSGSCCSDSDDKSDSIIPIEDDGRMSQNLQITSAMIHTCKSAFTLQQDDNTICYNQHQEAGSFERIPEENVSIVETLEGREERPETVRNINNGTFRRKLYFNPAYFDPELLLAPPPAAIDFLMKIREVISIAKHKMSLKRFAPSLNGIPEEDAQLQQVSDATPYCGASSRRSSVGAVSLKRENSRHRACAECPGCESTPPNAVLFKPCCGNAESKHNSIRKWLEDVPQMKQTSPAAENPAVHAKRKTSMKRRAPLVPVESNKEKDLQDSLEISGVDEQQVESSMKTVPAVKSKASPAPTPPPPPTTSTPSPTQTKVIEGAKVVKNGGTVVKKKLMDAVIKELVVVGQRGIETDFPSDIKSELEKDKYFGGCYDSDSLDKSEFLRREESGFQTPSDYGDIPLQPSPSLSSALPMDEEMVMRNDVFNKKTGNKTISKLKMSRPVLNIPEPDDHDYEIITLNPDAGTGDKKMKLYSLPELFNNNKGYSLVSEVYVNDGFGSTPSSPGNTSSTSGSSTPKIRYADAKKPGHLTIEVKDSPANYMYNPDDSDDFEPDTLDRKPSKKSNGYVINRNVYRQNSENFTDSLERHSQILLRTNGSFRDDSIHRSCSSDFGQTATISPFGRTFGSLRDIYEARTKVIRHQGSDNGSVIGSTRSLFGDTTDRDYTSYHSNVSVVGSTRSLFSDTTDYNLTSSRRRARNTKHLVGYRDDVQLNSDLRHVRRQRKPTPPGTVKGVQKPAPPDLIPPRPPKPQSIYEDPPPPRPLHSNPPLPPRASRPPLPPKNGKSRSTSHKKTQIKINPAQRPLPPIPFHNSRSDSVSSNSSVCRDFGTLSSTISGASADSLESSDYESFYAEPYPGDDDTVGTNIVSEEQEKNIAIKNGINHQFTLHSSDKRAQQSGNRNHARPGSRLESSDYDDPETRVGKQLEKHLRDNNGNENVKKTWRRVVERSSSKVPHKTEDSGYLSTDSSESNRLKGGMTSKGSSSPGHNSVSETDESLCDGASESGGESIATDSFFFGHCRKPTKITESVDSGVGSELVPMFNHPVLHEDVDENTSDSENVSFVTVLSQGVTRRIRC